MVNTFTLFSHLFTLGYSLLVMMITIITELRERLTVSEATVQRLMEENRALVAECETSQLRIATLMEVSQTVCQLVIQSVSQTVRQSVCLSVSQPGSHSHTHSHTHSLVTKTNSCVAIDLRNTSFSYPFLSYPYTHSL